MASSCFCQNIDAGLSNTLSSFWNNAPDTIIKPFFKKFTYKNKQVVFFGTKHKIRNADDSMYIQMEREITQLSPTLILTEGYGIMLNNKEETTKKLEDVGFCTHSGFEKGIQVKSWDISFNDLYYSLNKEFSDKELYPLMIIVEASRMQNEKFPFMEFFNNYESRGWPFKPEQKSWLTFIHEYNQYFSYPVKMIDAHSLKIPDGKLIDHPAVKKYYSIMQRLRDEHLIKTLQESLQTNDRIFIQAGAFHLLSLEKIITEIISKDNSNQFAEAGLHARHPGDSMATSSWVIDKVASGNKNIVLFGSINKSKRQFKAIRKEIGKVKPNLILTQGYAPVYDTEKQTIAQSRAQGFCRLQGITKGIRVNSWELPMNDVYYELKKKHNVRDIYFSLLCYTLLKSNKPIDTNTIDELAIRTLTEFGLWGYPLVIHPDIAFDLVKEINDHLKQDAPETPVKNLRNLLQNCINKDIITDWQTINLAHLVRLTKEYQNKYHTILIQADAADIPFLKTAL